jgi:hypothetical protein
MCRSRRSGGWKLGKLKMASHVSRALSRIGSKRPSIPFFAFDSFHSIYDITFTSRFVLTLAMRYLTVSLVSPGPLNCVSRLEFTGAVSFTPPLVWSS